MNKEQLAKYYTQAAIRHREGTDSGDYKKANKAHDKIVELLAVLRSRSDYGESVLRELIALGNDGVTVWAALHMLPIDPNLAKDELQRNASEASTPLLQFDAEMVLSEWEKGCLGIAGDCLPLPPFHKS